MNVGDGAIDCDGHRVGHLDHAPGVFRLDEVAGAEIAITKVYAEFDAGGNGRTNALHASHDGREVCINKRKPVLTLPVQNDHLVTEVPLDAKILVRNGPQIASTSAIIAFS